MSFTDDTPRPRRKPSLTPMIDVVFLLLVFFMLASRFGVDQVLPLPLASGGQGYEGPPRLVDVLPEGVKVNGVTIPASELAAKIESLTAKPQDTIILRGAEGAKLQRVVDVAGQLRAAGHSNLVLVE
ncbi:biopolymer transporter ExbD [Pseudooceanicola sp. CBS1P-1]|uniref:Biopolymer transporter ExbD n=1 Tax=Pseudooceanicola albus TaxID=2692189 RepID=A0A6L7G138_9RHOB|nr:MULTISPECIES: biopolymer transporter ExbD [Pseudooceanicola]MBT9384941.1 biopolymer transporter ExbD [Pseudooceanicola endophyticus]MXN18064.1 biopolymer transporter ExbD [Pseudooceanicola albus]